MLLVVKPIGMLVMFGPPGFSYVYFIYGMYHCLNFVTEEEGIPAAILIRGLMLIEPSPLHLNGPGKLCRHLGIIRDHNGIDIVDSESFYVKDSPLTPAFRQHLASEFHRAKTSYGDL